jgi:hypothetical protein
MKRKSSGQMRNPNASKRRSAVIEVQSGFVDIAQHKSMANRGHGKTVLAEVDRKVGKTILDDSPVAGEHYRVVSPIVGRNPSKGTFQAAKTNERDS